MDKKTPEDIFWENYWVFTVNFLAAYMGLFIVGRLFFMLIERPLVGATIVEGMLVPIAFIVAKRYFDKENLG